jgi:hypothetical protein
MRCLTCKYDLSKLTEHRCPECGRAFDPADPKTFHSAGRLSRRVSMLLVILIVVAIVLACVITILPQLRM